MKAIERIIAAAAFAAAFCFAGAAQTYKLKAPIADRPALLTSAGQSADVEMVKVLMNRIKVPYTMNAQIKAGEFKASGAKSIVVAIGGSSKGLGAAGVSSDVELARIKAVIAEAKKAGCRIIGLHIGGEARRGQLSDVFIRDIVPLCDYVIVVSEGNKDGLITQLCQKANIPLDSVDKISAVSGPLAKAFK